MTLPAPTGPKISRYAPHGILTKTYVHTSLSEMISLLLLIHMAAQDGVVGSGEKAELVRIIDAFGLPHLEWLELMEDINQAFTKRQDRRSAANDQSESLRDNLVDKALSYFEMKREAIDEEKLRLKYRRLVKKYHPDRHPDASAEEHKELEVKFQELQVYYEELLKLL